MNSPTRSIAAMATASALLGAAIALVAPSAALAAPACGTPAAIVVNGDSGQLYSYATDGTLVSSTTTASVLGDIAISSSGVLYGAPFFDNPPTIVSLDQATGATLTSVPITGAFVANPNGLSALPDGTLLAGFPGVSNLYVIDPATGVDSLYSRSLPAGYTSAGDFFPLADGDILALGATSTGTFLLRLHSGGTSTVIGQVPDSYGATLSAGNIYLAGVDGVIRRVDALPTTESTDALPTTVVVDAGFSLYGAASAQDAVVCPTPSVTPAATSALSGGSLSVGVDGYPADTDVTLTLRDANGTVIGSTVVHTDVNGAATGVVPVAGTASAGPATISAAAAGGSTATASETIVNPPTLTSTTLTSGAAPLDGTAEPGSTVTVRDPQGTMLCTTTATGQGAWSCTPTAALPEGASTVEVTAVGEVTATTSAQVTVTDTSAPAAPVIVHPASGTAVDTTTPTISGTAEPLSTVTVTDGTATPACTTAVSAAGTWSCRPAQAFPEGAVTLAATATDSADNTSAADTITFTVDTQAPAAPTVTTTTLDTGSSPLSGTSEAGSTVTVQAGGVTECTALADAAGRWSCVPSPPLPAGATPIVVTATDAAGNSSPGRSFAVTVTGSITPAETGVPGNTGRPTALAYTGTSRFDLVSSGIAGLGLIVSGLGLGCASRRRRRMEQ